MIFDDGLLNIPGAVFMAILAGAVSFSLADNYAMSKESKNWHKPSGWTRMSDVLLNDCIFNRWVHRETYGKFDVPKVKSSEPKYVETQIYHNTIVISYSGAGNILHPEYINIPNAGGPQALVCSYDEKTMKYLGSKVSSAGEWVILHE